MRIEHNRSIKSFNTFKVDVTAQELLFLENKEDFESEELKRTIQEKQFLILGEGSNTLFVNSYKGSVVLVRNRGIQILSENEKTVTVKVNAGENWTDFVLWSVENNLIGLQNLIDIPGNVGACPVQNIGAYGTEVKSYIKGVNVLNLHTFTTETLDNQMCEFGYRDSIFKRNLKGKVIIKDVTFELEKYKGIVDEKFLTYTGIQEKLNGREITLESVLNSVREIRREKLPSIDEYGSCGSTFKNIEVLKREYYILEKKFPGLPKFETERKGIFKVPTAYILENLGWKNKREGDVGTWIHHPLIVVNYGSATGRQIYDFILKIQENFKKKTSLDLDLEINIIQ